MGVLTDIVIAAPEDADAIARSSAPLKTWSGIDAKGIDLVKLAMLVPVLTDSQYDSADLSEFHLLAECGSDGPWVYCVASRLVEALTALDKDDIPLRAAEWFEFGRQEFRADGYRLRDVRLLLDSLRTLASAAATSERHLLLWLCL